MTIRSRWTVPIPQCSLQQWIFGSPQESLSDKPLLFDADKPENYLTKATYRLLSKRVAIGLIDAGLKPGDRVLLFSGNNLFFGSVFLGVLMAGGIFTGANPSYVSRELAYQLRDSGAKFMVASSQSLDTAFAAAKEAGLSRDKIYIFDAPAVPTADKPSPGPAGRKDGARHWTELVTGNLARAEKWNWTEPKDPAKTICCLNYSSGTTGVPKGVEISHRAYIANGVGVVHVGELDPDHKAKRARARGLCFLPMYHAYGQTYFIANLTREEIPFYIMPSFDFVKMLEHVQRYRITTLAAVPPIMVALAKHPLVKQYDLSSIEAIGCGAAPLAQEVLEEVQRRFPAGQVRVRQGWGMTEVTCTCLVWDPTVVEGGTAGVGELTPNCSARIMDLDGETMIKEPGKSGELWVTGPTLLNGYWRNPKATAGTTSVDKDGTRWLKTGDIAYVDKYEPGATFHVIDRLKELIKVKGNQVAPAELEGILLERPDIEDVAVVGVTIKGEELPRAYVVKAAGSKLTGQEVAKWMEGRVTRYKQLKGGVAFVDAVPKNPSGKILRKILREQAAKEVGDRKPQASRLS